MSGSDLLALLVSENPAGSPGDDLGAFWRASESLRAGFALPIERAVAGGFFGDRLACAFASGYQAALHVLVPALPPTAVASFCVTEEAGNHPRAIQTSIETVTSGRVVVSGRKRWSTMAPLADTLVVVAKSGTGEGGRPTLWAVAVPKVSDRLTVTTMAPTPFVPEVPHAELVLDGVELGADAILAGDGYASFVKPFRTIEDLHVQAAVLGYLLSVAARWGFPDVHRERLVALVCSALSIAPLDPGRPLTHVALAGLLAEIADLHATLEAEWVHVDDSERERWYRDRALVQVASKAREKRRERAWERLSGRE
jgi:alkylation response protein AidB-like acyl-CoA dehydrogenase